MNSVEWRKASRSDANGGNCVEVASIPDVVAAEWRKASHSDANGGDCVEVASVPGTVAVRDSKDPEGPKLLVERSAFQRFAGAVRNI